MGTYAGPISNRFQMNQAGTLVLQPLYDGNAYHKGKKRCLDNDTYGYMQGLTPCLSDG